MDNDVFFNKKGDKITSFVNHCYIIREQRARKKPQREKKMKNALHICNTYIYFSEREKYATKNVAK